MTFAEFRRALGAMFIGLALTLGGIAPAVAATVVTVNGEPISDIQVDQRLRLFRMEGNNTGRSGATQQLITEAIQIQEAKRLGINVSNAQVDDAFLQIARNLNVSRDRLTQMLEQGGVSSQTLQDRLRAAIAWNAVTEAAITPQVQISELELDQRAAEQIADFQNFDYILKEVTFIGIAKGEERDAGREKFFMEGKDAFMLPHRDPVLYYVQRLRDEAHRFAIGTHRAKRKKDVIKNPLDEIEGIGPTRKRALLNHFGSAKAVGRASLADLESVPTISKAMAQLIYDHFNRT